MNWFETQIIQTITIIVTTIIFVIIIEKLSEFIRIKLENKTQSNNVKVKKE